VFIILREQELDILLEVKSKENIYIFV
jgi:hypothetical protein